MDHERRNRQPIGRRRPASTGGSLHFRTGLNNDCNGVQSPVIKPTGTSTMSMYVNFILETGNFDRASAQVVDAKTGEKFLLTPTGAVYSSTNGGPLMCDSLGNLRGWSGSHARRGCRPTSTSLALCRARGPSGRPRIDR